MTSMWLQCPYRGGSHQHFSKGIRGLLKGFKMENIINFFKPQRPKKQREIIFSGPVLLSPFFLRSSAVSLKPLAKSKLRVLRQRVSLPQRDDYKHRGDMYIQKVQEYYYLSMAMFITVFTKNLVSFNHVHRIYLLPIKLAQFLTESHLYNQFSVISDFQTSQVPTDDLPKLTHTTYSKDCTVNTFLLPRLLLPTPQPLPFPQSPPLRAPQ